MTERVRSQVQESEMSFLRKIEGVTLFKKMSSSETRKSLNIKSLLLRIAWPCRQNLSRKTPQASFTSQSKREKTS